jgi:hypothetical protein
MNRRIDDDQLVQLLRQAGRDVELDRTRIMSIIDGAPAGPQARPLRRPAVRSPRRSPMQLIALPMAAGLATGLVLVVKENTPPSERIKVVTGQSPTTQQSPTPTSTSQLGAAKSITAQTGAATDPTAPATPETLETQATPVAPSTTSAQRPGSKGRVSVEVAPTAQGSTYQLPLRNSQGWLLVGSAPDGSQPRSYAGSDRLGPAQVMGQGQTIEVGPYDVSWAPGSATTTRNRSGTWMVVPGSARKVVSGLRIPVRVQRIPAKITVLTGTIGGGGHVTVSLTGSTVTAELPSCTKPICPAIVTITLDPEHRASASTDVVIDLNATGPEAKVGLAAVQLG